MNITALLMYGARQGGIYLLIYRHREYWKLLDMPALLLLFERLNRTHSILF